MSKVVHQQKRPLSPRAVAWSSTAIVQWMRDCIAASGADPTLIPDEPARLLRLPDVEARVGLKRSSIYRKIEEGSFPRPILLGAERTRQPPKAA
jgi:predicted DNA-binding transcriptional regulator AlpA